MVSSLFIQDSENAFKAVINVHPHPICFHLLSSFFPILVFYIFFFFPYFLLLHSFATITRTTDLQCTQRQRKDSHKSLSTWSRSTRRISSAGPKMGVRQCTWHRLLVTQILHSFSSKKEFLCICLIRLGWFIGVFLKVF